MKTLWSDQTLEKGSYLGTPKFPDQRIALCLLITRGKAISHGQPSLFLIEYVDDNMSVVNSMKMVRMPWKLVNLQRKKNFKDQSIIWYIYFEFPKLEEPLVKTLEKNFQSFSTKCIDQIFAATNNFFRVTTKHKTELFTLTVN